MTDTTQPRRLKRLWMPTATLALGVGAFAALVWADALEPMLQFYLGMGLMLGTPLLLAVWAIFFSGVKWWQRLGLLVGGGLAAVGLVFVLSLFFEFDGSISGSGIPRLRLKGSRRAEARLDALKVEAEGQIDLTPKKDTDYPQFLGRDRDGVARGVRLETDWKAHPPRELWRKEVGLGWSAFAVAGDFAVTQEQREDQELTVCYELKTGKVRWKHGHAARFHDKQGGDGPRATPTLSGGRVYSLGGTGVLDCLDGATGELIWSRDTLGENGLQNLIWGKACSPLILDDKVIVTGGREKHDSLLAYDRETGSPLWKAGRDDASYSSPAAATLAGTRQILSVNAHSVTGHDPADGKILWEFSWPKDWAKASQPVPLPGDRVLVTAGYGVGSVMLHVVRGSDGAWSAEKVWASRKMRTQFSNVVIAHNCAFGLDERYLPCLDLETGGQRWEGERFDFGQVMLAGDVLVVQAEKGDVVLVSASPDGYRELARLPALHGMTWNNPVLSGPYLLVRNDREAVCYEVPVQKAAE